MLTEPAALSILLDDEYTCPPCRMNEDDHIPAGRFDTGLGWYHFRVNSKIAVLAAIPVL